LSIFAVETYVVKPEKQVEYQSLMQRLLQYKKQNPQLFNEVKSFGLFHQMFGGLAGAYIEMWEFDSMADLEKCWTKEPKDEGFMKIHKEFMLLIVPDTFSINIWNAVE
jgi:hypothetical protein